MSKKRLGRGLDALLSGQPETQIEQQDPTPVAQDTEILIEDISPSPYQPRRIFDQEALADLANSIKVNGLLQPVVVRVRPQGGYELIAGERRLRAAGQAGLKSIPAVIRSVTDEEASALALIENMQREDLSALEEAQGLARLRDEFSLTQQEIADAVGKSRVAVANHLRLLNLGSLARQLLENGDIEMGHARALLALEGAVQDRAAHVVAEQGMSVRQAEAFIRKLNDPAADAQKKPKKEKDPETLRLERRLMDHLGARVSIEHAGTGKGELKISYSSLDELQGVLAHLGVAEDH